MQRWTAITCLVLCAICTSSNFSALAQQPEGLRKVQDRVPPQYPELARQLHLAGTVKLVVTVAPNGGVKSVRPIGGNPVLLKAAQDAVCKWKWAPAPQESQEPVDLRFHPN
jgi:TonB family protein